VRNKEVAEKFYELAEIAELANENPFKIKAYLEAARVIENLAIPIEEIASKGELEEIRGIGKGIAEKINQYLQKGKIDKLEEFKKKIPETLIEMEKIPGLGAKRVKALYEDLHIQTVDDLRKAAEAHKIRQLEGFGEKTEQKILEGISAMRDKKIDRVLIGIAMPIAESIVDSLKTRSHVDQILICGSIRRMKDTIGDIDILVTSKRPSEVMESFSSLDLVKEVIAKGETKTSIVTLEGVQVDLRVVEPGSFGAAIQYFTGSKQHNVHMRELAIKKNLKLNEYGVFDLDTNRKVAGETEEEIYDLLGMQWIPPEMREDNGEIELALEGKIPEIVKLEEIKGDIHVHSTYSDGRNTIEELMKQSMKMGYEYLVITDHARALGIAGGLSIEKYLEEKKEIDELNKKYKHFKVFLGTELNILTNGEVDFKDDDLKIFVICLAGIHTGMSQKKEQITNRIINAMKNKYVRVIVHPTGRIIGGRDEYEVDVDAVFNEAKKHNTIFEINASFERLDLNEVNARKAKENFGLKFEIGTDAHSTDSMMSMRYGVGVARRAGLTKDDIINTMNLTFFERFIKGNNYQ
jgi:DNA polymerase (family 10)